MGLCVYGVHYIVVCEIFSKKLFSKGHLIPSKRNNALDIGGHGGKREKYIDWKCIWKLIGIFNELKEVVKEKGRICGGFLGFDLSNWVEKVLITASV